VDQLESLDDLLAERRRQFVFIFASESDDEDIVWEPFDNQELKRE
jgi:hypothetical protein